MMVGTAALLAGKLAARAVPLVVSAVSRMGEVSPEEERILEGATGDMARLRLLALAGEEAASAREMQVVRATLANMRAVRADRVEAEIGRVLRELAAAAFK